MKKIVYILCLLPFLLNAQVGTPDASKQIRNLTAGNVIFTPSGTIIATDAQAAIAEAYADAIAYADANDATGPDDQTAAEVNITDSGDYFTGTELEAITQEIGATNATQEDSLTAHNTRLQDLENYDVQSYAVIYKAVVDTYATTTTPDTIDGTWVSDVSDDFTHSNGVITYNGTLAKRYLVTVTASVESNTVMSEYYLRIAEDGTVEAESSQYFLTADVPETMSCQGVVVLTTGKTFFLTGAALAGTPDIKFNTITFSLSRL